MVAISRPTTRIKEEKHSVNSSISGTTNDIIPTVKKENHGRNNNDYSYGKERRNHAQQFGRDIAAAEEEVGEGEKIKDQSPLVPLYLLTKGLTKQHTDSFNYFVDVDLKKIVKANKRITSDVDPDFFIE